MEIKIIVQRKEFMIQEKLDLSKKTGLNDIIFKAIMYTKEIVLSKLLETLYEEDPGELHYLSPEIPVKKFIEKGKRLDLYLEGTDSYVDIEVTNDYNIFIVNRNLGFGFEIYCNTVKKRRCIMICIRKFMLFN